MNQDAKPPAPRVPTLTEVVEVGVDSMLPVDAAAPSADAAPPHEATLDEADLVQRVLSDVQRQIDLMLEYRLREALSPALARLSQALVDEARDELASTLREVVARAVAQELSRQRPR
jgi:hypothetical protein